MYKTIHFTENEMIRVEQFAQSISWKHPHFRDKRNKLKRTSNQVKESVVIGKLAELGLWKWFSHYYKDSKIGEVDFNIYPKGIVDDYDLKIDEVTISVKSSKPGSSCLMTEVEKFDVDHEGNLLRIDKVSPADLFIFVHVDVKERCMHVMGAVSIATFWDKKTFMPRGMTMNRQTIQQLFFNENNAVNSKNSKGFALLADNYAMHVKQLHNPLEIINKQLKTEKMKKIS